MSTPSKNVSSSSSSLDSKMTTPSKNMSSSRSSLDSKVSTPNKYLSGSSTSCSLDSSGNDNSITDDCHADKSSTEMEGQPSENQSNSDCEMEYKKVAGNESLHESLGNNRSEVVTEAENVAGSERSLSNIITPPKENKSSSDEVTDENVEEERGVGGIRLPLARIKKIMKVDHELGLTSQESVYLMAKATELFIESLAIESYNNAVTAKRKTISKADFNSCIRKVDALIFLDGAID